MRINDLAGKPLALAPRQNDSSSFLINLNGGKCSYRDGVISIKGESPTPLLKIDLTGNEVGPLVRDPRSQTFVNLSRYLTSTHRSEIMIDNTSYRTPVLLITFKSREEGVNPYIGKKYSDLTMEEYYHFQESTPNDAGYEHKLAPYYPEFSLMIDLDSGKMFIADLDPKRLIVALFAERPDLQEVVKIGSDLVNIDRILPRHLLPEGINILKEVLAGINGGKVVPAAPKESN